MNSLRPGSEIPRKGNWFTAWLGRVVLKLMGWRIEGELPNRPQMIMAVAPHSSNFDFIITMAGVFSLRLHVSYMAKHTLFRFPIKRILLSLGGIPVQRGSSQGLVGKMVEEFNNNPKLLLGITPEGTRGKVVKWKKGFALMAQAANVPILPVILDYKKKTIKFESLINDVSDIEKTIAQMKIYTLSAMPKNMTKET